MCRYHGFPTGFLGYSYGDVGPLCPNVGVAIWGSNKIPCLHDALQPAPHPSNCIRLAHTRVEVGHVDVGQRRRGNAGEATQEILKGAVEVPGVLP